MIVRNMKFVTLVLIALGFPALVAAQTCPNPQPIQCGAHIDTSSSSGVDNIDQYGCMSDTALGRELFYLLDLEYGADVDIVLDPDNGIFAGWDAVLAVLPEFDGECYPYVYNGCSDVGGRGDPEYFSGSLPPGKYFIIVDGYNNGSYGGFVLDLDCSNVCDNCVDADQDGYYDYDSSGCTCGQDCDDADPDRNPGAPEICGDSIDQDCDGSDDVCGACTSLLTVQCEDSSSANTDVGTQNLNNYCGSNDNRWSAKEYVFAITEPADGAIGVSIDNMGGQQLDAFAFLDHGVAGVCNKDACRDTSLSTSGSQYLAFYADSSDTYYISVDGRNGAHGIFDYSFSCLDEECSASEQLHCYDTLSSDTTSLNNGISAYRGIHRHMLAPDKVYSFKTGVDAEVTLVMYSDGTDLTLIVLEEDGSGLCQPGNLIAVSDIRQNGNANPPEIISLVTTADVTYYVVVDGPESSNAGAFSIRADCVIVCPDGLTDCHGHCVDLASDPDFCGSCDVACSFDHAEAICSSGACIMGECESSYADCNSDTQDGCEVLLGTLQDCSECGDACTFDNATPLCENFTCVMGDCDHLFGDCNYDSQDGCEVELITNENCGECNLACILPEFCYQGDCTDQCPNGLTNCLGVCVDTNSDPENCGDCGEVCLIANATAVCVDAACDIASCNPGFGDCNEDITDGCETTLGTDYNCSACGDTCAFPHAAASCQDLACVMGACDPGWHDCNTSPLDGCEDDLTTVQNCGACGNSCNANQICLAGQCILDCPSEETDCSGVCVDLNSDIDNCGSCGTACSYQNASATCVNGSCVMGACDSGFDDCNEDPDDGCEIDLNTIENCGVCGNVCPDGEVCHEGTCITDCPDGLSPCEGTCVDLQSDEENCGNCGNVCAEEEVCESGQCVYLCPDEDGDGYESDSCGGTDCNDADASIHPGAEEVCDDDIDQDCNGLDDCACPDEDGDGHTQLECGGDDCDDGNGFIYPGATEICYDGIDQDCDGADGPCPCQDTDGDGHKPIDCGGDDCNDNDRNSHPGAKEACGDGIDQDCDGHDAKCDDGCGCTLGGESRALSLSLLGLLALMLLGEKKRRHVR